MKIVVNRFSNFKKLIFLVVILCLIVSQVASASASGFVSGQIWYSADTLVAGETVKVYTAVWNGDSSSLSLHVDFYDKSIVLGSRDVVVAPSTLEDVYISWKVTEGDHLISAKITSSIIKNAGKEEVVTLDNKATEADHQYVSVVIKNQDGTIATTSDVLKSQVDKIGGNINATISDVIPKSVGGPINNNLGSLDNFRMSSLMKVDVIKKATQKQVDSFSSLNPIISNPKTVSSSKSKSFSTVPVKSSSGVEKPIAYVKLFFLSVISLILYYQIIFYGFILIALFYVLRYLYRKIRNR